jgi:hypothetical protein
LHRQGFFFCTAKSARLDIFKNKSSAGARPGRDDPVAHLHLKEEMLMTIRTTTEATFRLSFLPPASAPALATLKEELPTGERLALLVGQALAEKGIDRATIRFLQGHALLAPLLGHLLMQAPPSSGVSRQLQRFKVASLPLPVPAYTGSPEENKAIDNAIHRSRNTPAFLEEGMRATTWRGVAGAYFGGGFTVPQALRCTRVVIIGAGAAGILAARALRNAGMENIVLLEKAGAGGVGGIWSREMPRRILHAVPFDLRFEQALLQAGPASGQKITDFLEQLVSPPPEFHWPAFPYVLPAEVVQMIPGDLHHTVIYLDEHGRERSITAPVVINAMGVGEPLVPNWDGAMTTDLASHQAGARWQEVWSEGEARRYHRRKLVFVSLSNATLSMLWQIHHWNTRGMEIDYHVLSHYPEASIEEPQARVEHRGRVFRLYRDLERFQLLRMAGDMDPFRTAFEEARTNQKIIAQVAHWTREHRGEQGVVVVIQDHGTRQHIPCDHLYTLIGYGPRASTLEAMGLQVNHPHLGAAAQDYDGEAQKEPGATGRDRLFPGYFCIGVRNGFNENVVLLPGLLHQIPNLVAGVVLRAAEDVVRHKNSSW